MNIKVEDLTINDLRFICQDAHGKCENCIISLKNKNGRYYCPIYNTIATPSDWRIGPRNYSSYRSNNNF